MYSLPQIQDIVLSHLTDFPDALFLSDTELVLDPGVGSILNLEGLLGMLHRSPVPYHDEVIADYVRQLITTMLSMPAKTDALDRRTVLGGVTKLIIPTVAMERIQEPEPLAEGLASAWALASGDTLTILQSEKFLAQATEEELDARARAKVKAYARGLRVERVLGGVLLRGGRQTSSVLLYLDACAKAIKLPPCEHGYIVAVPDQWHTVIIPADDIDLLLPMFDLVLDTYARSDKPFTYFLYHWLDGRMRPIFTDRGVTATPELANLHGPSHLWPVTEEFWGDEYSA